MTFFKKWLVIATLVSSLLSLPITYAQEQQTDDMITLIKNSLAGFGEFYAALSEEQRDDLARLIDELIEIGSQATEYCGTDLKYNELILKYKKHKNLEHMCLKASLGCSTQNDDPAVCRNVIELDTFDCQVCLEELATNDFYNQLTSEEQEELKSIIMDMFSFCKTTIQSFEMLLTRYATIKDNITFFMQETNQELLVTIGFDHPFPSITYKIA